MAPLFRWADAQPGWEMPPALDDVFLPKKRAEEKRGQREGPLGRTLQRKREERNAFLCTEAREMRRMKPPISDYMINRRLELRLKKKIAEERL
jgi:hypothetical protein